MIQWVYEKAAAARGLSGVYVATEDERIVEAVKAFGGEVVMTSPSCQSGTDRVAETVKKVAPRADIVVNVQGDEPMIRSHDIEAAIGVVTEKKFPIGTVAAPFTSLAEFESRDVVKVLCDATGRAIYFSRFPIPYSRGKAPEDARELAPRRHVGLYVYTRETLMKLAGSPPAKSELGESLEQLRAMEQGIAIGVAPIDRAPIGVDTPEDLERVKTALVRG